MRKISATVTVGRRYGIRSRVRMIFWPFSSRCTNSAMINPISISNTTHSREKRTVFQIAVRKYVVDKSFT